MLYIDDNVTRRFGQVIHCAAGMLTAAVVLCAYLILYAPQMGAVEDARNNIGELKVALEKAPAIHRQHRELTRQIREMEEQLAEILRRVPKQAGESEFLSSLASLADEVGMEITNLNPKPPEQLAGYSRMEISITGVASHPSVCRFVDRLHELPRLVKVVGLDVDSDPNGQEVYPVTLTVSIFFNLVVEPTGEEGTNGRA